MRIGLRQLKPETVRWLKAALRQGRLSRTALARGLCERDDWRNPRQKLCVSSASKALPELATQLGLALPPPRPRPGRGCQRRAVAVPQTCFAGTLEELGAVRLRLAEELGERRTWQAMLAASHPQGRAAAPGCRLTYLLESERAGLLGGLSFVAAPMRLGPRDAAIGWGARARGAHIAEVVSNDRFLLLPGVRVPQLASHALGQAARRLAADWKKEHAVRPLLLETCVGGGRSGTSYRAAGWQCAGETRGRPPGGGPPTDAKSVWLLPLAEDWQAMLAAEPARELGSWPRLELPDEASFAEREFGRSDLPDGRLRRRLLQMGAAWEQAPGQRLPMVFPDAAGQRAAYRFLHNRNVTLEDILQPHREAMAERSALHRTVLLVQDTTALKYKGLRNCTTGLGPLRKRTDKARGLWVHAAVAFTEGRRPLGVSGLEVWARPEEKPEDEREKESRRWLRGFEQGAELGKACPGTRVIVVGDRESDIYELLELQAARSEEAGLLVRANAGRRRRAAVQVKGRTTIKALAEQAGRCPLVVRCRKVVIDSRGGKHPRPRRVARTEVRSGRVQLQPPASRPGSRPLEVLAVQVRETAPPRGEKPLEWLLVSSDGEPTKRDALRIVQRYESRWGIEEYFRVVKSGMRIQDRRLRTGAGLAKCLAFDAIEAWRVFQLDRYARDAPDTPASEVLTAQERYVIDTLSSRGRLLPPRERGRPPPGDIRSYVVRLARTVGFIPSKRRPLPGNEILWRAWLDLQRSVRMLEAAAESPEGLQAAFGGGR